MPGIKQAADRGPFTGGYVDSIPAFMAKPDQLVSPSVNCFIDPISGGVERRLGCTVLNATLHASTRLETTGLLTGSYTARCRKLFAIESPSLSTGYPTLCGLFGEDDQVSTFPAGDNGFRATVWLNSHNSGLGTNALKNYSLLEEWAGGTNYGIVANGTASTNTLRVVPIWYESGDGVYNRGALTGTAGTDQFMQQFLACGSRSVLQTQNWLYAPNLRATPWRWNKAFNEDSTTSRVVRIFPTGPFPPLFPPTVTTPTEATSGTTWSAGDTFYISVIFQFEDGSYSAPFIPRPTQASGLTSGLGLVTVGVVGETKKFTHITYSNIAIGPEGTVARILCRTPKQTRSASTDNVTVAPLDLRVIGVLRNNTQTSYVDYAGNDTSLLEDDDVVRVDHTLPRRARFIGTGDQRAILGYTLPNTAAIMLAPIGGVSAKDRNINDASNTNYGSSAYLVRITSTQLELHCNPGAAAPDFTAPGNAIAFTFATYDTLEKMVDAINATVVGDLANQWGAQLAPGIDPTMPSSSLTLTTFDIANCTGTGTTLATANSFSAVGIGMKVSGTGITAGTYVVSKASDTSITLSAASTSANVTLTFYQETGDNGIVTGGTLGYIRAFSGSYPLLLHMKPSAFPGYDKPDKTSVYFTVSSPGAATAGVSLAPNAWVVGNRRIPHSSPRSLIPRSCTGIVDIEGAAIVAYSDGIYLFANQRGANTGEDFDYRLFTVNDTRGCISYLGLVAGNGWAAYPTTEGIMAVDKNRREFVISGDVFNPTDNAGSLAYEIAQSAASVASDSDDQHFAMAVMGSRLAVGLRDTDYSNYLFYDFSPGIEASGVEELINPETKRPYIWSPPSIYNQDATSGGLITPGAMGSVYNATGRHDYIATDSNNGSTAGRIDELDANYGDNGYTSFYSDAVPAPVLASPFHSVQPQNVEVVHRALSAASGSAYVAFSNENGQQFYTSAVTVTACNTTLDDVSVTKAASFASVSGGMSVSGTNITVGTKVLRKVNTGEIILTLPATGTGTPDLTFTPPTTGPSTGYLRTINRDATASNFQRQVIPVDQGQRGKTDIFWMMWRTNAVPQATIVDRLYKFTLQYDETEKS